ncbi:MAG: NAD(P)/FAD-dependent oxidoreductase [Legionellaceae bacterium]|nr:NAD(P)/FAD-dependent oxidoreductase [Legionellaceae bacterium]
MNVYLLCLTLLFSPLMYATKVAIIGGGLAGLSAAKKLHEAHIETVVFEASDRLGGRVGTQINPYGQAFYNTGGEFIDSTQTEIRDLAHALGLEFKTWYRPRQKKLVETVLYDGQKFQTEYEYLEPFFAKNSNQRKYLEQLAEDINLLKRHPDASRALSIQQRSVKDYFLYELGAPTALADYFFSTIANYYAQDVSVISAGVIEEMMLDVDTRMYQISGKHDEKYRVIGGTGQITDALLKAASTWHDVVIHADDPVKYINQLNNKYIINHQADEVFDYVISTLPPPMLKKIQVDIDGYQEAMARVFDEKNYPYGTVANVYLFFDQRIWKNTAYIDGLGDDYQGYDGGVILLNHASLWDETNGQLDAHGAEISEGIIRAYFSGDIVQNQFMQHSSEQVDRLIVQPMLEKLERLWPGLKQTYQGFRFNTHRYAYAGAVPPGVSYKTWGSYPLRMGDFIFAGEFFDDSDDQSFMNGAIKSGYRAADMIRGY